jgi:DNA replication protein DnaC
MKKRDDDSLDLLLQKMRWLRLPGMAQLVSDLIDLATKDNLTTLDVLHRLCDDERASRLQRAVDRRIHDARFPELNTVDGFDFDFDPVRKKFRARYLALHDLAFLEKGINPLFIGMPGRGKTFLARALAYRACQGTRRVVVTSAMRMLNDLSGAEVHGRLELALRRYVRADFLVIDDFAVLAMDPSQAKLAFQVISDRYDYRRATCITSNRDLAEWHPLFHDALLASAAMDRLLHGAHVIVIEGDSYRNPPPARRSSRGARAQAAEATAR